MEISKVKNNIERWVSYLIHTFNYVILTVFSCLANKNTLTIPNRIIDGISIRYSAEWNAYYYSNLTNSFYYYIEINSTFLEGKVVLNGFKVLNEYIVSIRYYGKHMCTGILISERHVLAVIECLYEINASNGFKDNRYEVWIPSCDGALKYHFQNINVHYRREKFNHPTQIGFGLIFVSYHKKQCSFF